MNCGNVTSNSHLSAGERCRSAGGRARGLVGAVAGGGSCGNGMGKSMKKVAVVAMFAVAVSTASGLAADLKAAPPAPPPSPWDFAFGSGIMSDYNFRGITQSAHKPSVAAYFEPRYNITKILQALRRRGRREHRLSQSRGDGTRRVRRHPADLRQARARFRRLVLRLSRRPVLQRPRGRRPDLHGGQWSAAVPAQRQRGQTGCELLGSLRQGHLHRER